MTSVLIEVGSRSLAVEGESLPPVGTRFTVDGHLTDDGGGVTLEVTAHEWRLPVSGREDDVLELNVWVRTRKLSPEEISCPTTVKMMKPYPSPEDRPQQQHWADGKFPDN